MAITEITKDNFDAEFKNSSLPAVLDFWGPKCAPCMALMPKFHELSDNPKYSGKIKFCSVNTAENKRVAVSCRVMGNPTFIFYRNGKETARLSGGKATIEAITQKVDELAV